jgi:hypothetical protein
MPVAQALSAFRRSRRGDLPDFPIIFPISSAKTGSHPTASATTQFFGIGLGGTSGNLSRKLRGFGDPFSLCARLWSQKYRQRAIRLCIEKSRS